MFYAAALVCTLIAWCAQAYTTVIKKEIKLNLLMPLFYCIACIGFAIDSFMSGAVIYGMMDAIIAVLALLILVIMISQRK